MPVPNGAINVHMHCNYCLYIKTDININLFIYTSIYIYFKSPNLIQCYLPLLVIICEMY